MIKTCKQCGKDFEVQVHNQMFCSTNCRQKFHNDKRRSQCTVFTRVCPQCGEQFTTTNWAKKFCSDRCCRKFHSTVAPPELLVVRCYNCGHEFKQTFPNEKFCSDYCRLDYFYVGNGSEHLTYRY